MILRGASVWERWQDKELLSSERRGWCPLSSKSIKSSCKREALESRQQHDEGYVSKTWRNTSFYDYQRPVSSTMIFLYKRYWFVFNKSHTIGKLDRGASMQYCPSCGTEMVDYAHF